MITIAAILGIVLVAAICLSASAVLLLPLAVSGAIFFIIRALLDKVMDVSWMNGGAGVALFILIFWVVI